MKKLIPLLALLALAAPLGATDLNDLNDGWSFGVYTSPDDKAFNPLYINSDDIWATHSGTALDTADRLIMSVVGQNAQLVYMFGPYIFEGSRDFWITGPSLNAGGAGPTTGRGEWGVTIDHQGGGGTLYIDAGLPVLNAIFKQGEGTVVWTGTGGGAGVTIYAEGGTLLLNGNNSVSGVVVENGATFGGTGTLTVPYNITVRTGGALYGKGLTVDGIIEFDPSTALKVDFSLTNPALFASTRVFGKDDSSARMTLDVYNLVDTGGDFFKLISAEGGLGFHSHANYFDLKVDGLDADFIKKENTGGYTAANLWTWEYENAAGLYTITLDYKDVWGGAGQNVWMSVDFVPVPEPGTYALIIGGLGALALLRRRKR